MRRPNPGVLSVAVAVLLTACTDGPDTTENEIRPPVDQLLVIAAGGDAVDEGAGGALLTFGFTLSAPSSSDVAISYETRSGSATQGTDFVARAGTLTVAAGATTGIEVPVIDDADDEADETAEMHITSVSTATIAAASVTGTILDDDNQPVPGSGPDSLDGLK
jgi:hypothetical protein